MIIQPGIYTATPDRIDPVAGEGYSRKSRVPGPGPGPEPGGDLVHGQPFTIEGSGFGVKSPAAPLIWDDCSHGEPLSSRWDHRSPSTSAAEYQMNYRTPSQLGRGIAPPHDNVSAYLCGCHYGNGPTNGYNVYVGRNISDYSSGLITYASYYHRVDPNWVRNPSDDRNYKVWWWQQGHSYGVNSPTWYFGYAPGMDPASATLAVGINNNHTSGNGLASPDTLGNTLSNWRGTIPNPSTDWRKFEHFHRYADGSDGYLYGVCNNQNSSNAGSGSRPGAANKIGIPYAKCFMWHEGRNDGMSGSNRHELIGGYARDYNLGANSQNNWRYFADLYVDNTYKRVVLTNNSTYGSATVVEPQPPVSWSDTSITFRVNKGRLSSGPVHCFVFDESNSPTYIGELAIT